MPLFDQTTGLPISSYIDNCQFGGCSKQSNEETSAAESDDLSVEVVTPEEDIPYSNRYSPNLLNPQNTYQSPTPNAAPYNPCLALYSPCDPHNHPPSV